ncbi:T9SS C-terminal target domain-containing protein [Emticicia sp. C21]|nr:T9SS C-terminal target domain-containing protein [Emticicia sp. C21]
MTKTAFKNCIYIGLLLFSLVIKTNGQQITQPEICKNPPKGYELGGDFTVSPMIACLDYNTNISALSIYSPAGIDKGSEGYLFNYKDKDSLVFTKETRYSANKEGIYWIIQRGTITIEGISKIVLSCKSLEVIKTEVPELEFSTCGPKTINILIKDSPVNRKQSGYTIAWNDKDILTFKPTGLPLTISHIYEVTPSSPPKIQGFYERQGIKACFGQPSVFIVKDFTRIQKLESLNYGKEVKIQMQDGKPNKEYYIEYKAKTATEWVESAIKIKRNTADTTGTATVSGLESTSQYCFRLVEKDTCNYAISYSNEMCTPVVLSTEYTKGSINVFPNPTEDKILINSSGAPVRFVELLDTRGRLIYKGEISSDTFNLSEFEKVKYILRLYDANKKLLDTRTLMKW